MTTEQKEGSIPLRERRSIEEEWQGYKAAVIPKDAPEVQLVESRRAFYAGARSLFSLISGGLDADHEPTDLDVAYLDELTKELAAFARDVQEGKA